MSLSQIAVDGRAFQMSSVRQPVKFREEILVNYSFKRWQRKLLHTCQNQITCWVSGWQCFSRVCCFQSLISMLLIPHITSSNSLSSKDRNSWLGINSQNPKTKPNSDFKTRRIVEISLTFLQRQKLLLLAQHKSIIHIQFHIFFLVVFGYYYVLSIGLQFVQFNNAKTIIFYTERWLDYVCDVVFPENRTQLANI